MLAAASQATVHAIRSHRPASAQAQQASPAPGSSFASMLDESQTTTAQAQADATQADDSQTKANASSSKASDTNAAKSDTTDASQDGKAAAKADSTDQSQPVDKTAKTDKTVDAKTAAEIKVVKSAASQDGEPIDSKPKDNTDQNAAAQAVAQAIAPAPVVKTPDAAATLVPALIAAPTATPTTDDTDTPPSLDAQALQAAATGKLDPTLAGKMAAATHADAKPQGPAADTDDEAIAHARGATSAQETLPAASFDTLATNAGADAPKAAANLAQSGALPAPAQTAAAATTAAAAAQQAPQAVAVPLSGVAVEIAGKAAAGKNQFEIRLDPPELGRIEVHIAVDHDGNVTSRMIADRQDTLDLLRRDAGGLERALQDAGLKTSDNGLQFSLRDQSAYQQNQQQDSASGNNSHIVVDDDAIPADIAPRSYGRLAGLGSGLDIQV